MATSTEQFWERVALESGLLDATITTKKSWFRQAWTRTPHVVAPLDGERFEVGVRYAEHHESTDATYAATTISGLPLGLSISEPRRRPQHSLFGDSAVWIECDDDTSRRVGIGGVRSERIDMDGLILEQRPETLDLSSYLTPSRQTAIGEMTGMLEWTESEHQWVCLFEGDPYPSRRNTKRAERGDVGAQQVVEACVRKVVDLIATCRAERERVLAELLVDS